MVHCCRAVMYRLHAGRGSFGWKKISNESFFSVSTTGLPSRPITPRRWSCGLASYKVFRSSHTDVSSIMKAPMKRVLRGTSAPCEPISHDTPLINGTSEILKTSLVVAVAIGLGAATAFSETAPKPLLVPKPPAAVLLFLACTTTRLVRPCSMAG